MGRVLLIDPPSLRFMGKTQPYAPLGLTFLAANLEKNGFETLVYNADLEYKKQAGESGKRAFADTVNSFDLYIRSIVDPGHEIYGEVEAAVAEVNPDIIGMTVRTGNFFIAKTIVARLKESFPDIPVVIGGNHVTAHPEQSLDQIRADYAIRGEAEETLVRFMRSWRQNPRSVTTLESLSFRQGREIRHNPQAEFIRNLDELPFPRKDLILHHEVMSPEHFGGILTSRGCPFACAFCDSHTTWGRKVRRRSPVHVVDEMVATKERFGTTFFTFYDDSLVTREADAFALCEEMERRGLSALPKKDFRWWCEVHPKFINERLVARMKRSGCAAIGLGIESGAQRMLKEMNKKTSLADIRNAAKAIKNNEVDLVAFAMIGFPTETEDDIRATVELIQEIEPESAKLTVFTPLPGTETYRYCQEHGLLDYSSDYSNMFYFRNSGFYNPNIPKDRSAAIIKDTFAKIDSAVEENRRKRIERVLEKRLFESLHRALGLRLTLQDVPGADFILDCEQRYDEAKIFIGMKQKNASIGAERIPQVQKAVSEALLSELPQYKAVVVRAVP